MTRIVSGARKYPAHAKRAEHRRGRLVDQPGIVIAEIDIDDDVLARRALGCEVVHIRPEIDVAGTGRERGQNGRGIFWCGALERIVADSAGRGRLTSIEADVDDSLRRAQRLRSGRSRRSAAASIEDLDSAIGPIADIDVSVIAEDDAMRMSTTRGPERPGGTCLAVGWHAADHAGGAPLAVVLISFPTIRGRVDDDTVVAVAVGDVDASRRMRDGVRERVHGDVRRLVQKRVTGVEVASLTARAERVRRRLCAVTHSLGANLRDECRARALTLGDRGVVFLNDPVAVAADPNIALVIDKAPMGTMRQVGGVSAVHL